MPPVNPVNNVTPLHHTPAMPLDPNQIAFAKDLLTTLRDHHTTKGKMVEAALEVVAAGQNLSVAAEGSRKMMALEIIHLIESRAPESELWTSSPDAAEVTPESRLGDHLYLTRKHFGLTC